MQIVEMLLQHGDTRQARRKNRQYRLSTGLRGVTPLQLAASHGSVSLLNELMHSRETFAGLSWDQVRRKYLHTNDYTSAHYEHAPVCVCMHTRFERIVIKLICKFYGSAARHSLEASYGFRNKLFH